MEELTRLNEENKVLVEREMALRNNLNSENKEEYFEICEKILANNKKFFEVFDSIRTF